MVSMDILCVLGFKLRFCSYKTNTADLAISLVPYFIYLHTLGHIKEVGGGVKGVMRRKCLRAKTGNWQQSPSAEVEWEVWRV